MIEDGGMEQENMIGEDHLLACISEIGQSMKEQHQEKTDELRTQIGILHNSLAQVADRTGNLDEQIHHVFEMFRKQQSKIDSQCTEYA